jgi:ribonuclease BN (tRNA processing enzyme)
MLKLYVLGCGDAFASGGRRHSSYLLEAFDRLVLLDCGPTTLLALKRAGIEPRRLNAILISHLHGDHFGGLPFLFIDYLYRQARNEPLTIAGPPGTESKVRELMEVMYDGAGAALERLPLEFRVLQPDRLTLIAGMEVFPIRVPHQSRLISLALKVSYQGKQVLFSGDSLWTESLVDHAHGVDLFLCECSFYHPQPGMHVNYEVLQADLKRLQCRRLILTHLGEEMLACRDQLAIQVADDGMEIEI